MLPDGLIAFINCGWTGQANQRHAKGVFMAEQRYPILKLPAGQGLIVKR